MSAAPLVAALLAGSGVLLAWPGSWWGRQRRDEPGRPGRSGRSPEAALPVGAAVVAGLGAAVLVGGRAGMAVGLGTALGTFVAVRRLEPPAVRRRREALEDGLPLAVDLLASCLAAGQAPGSALDEVARAAEGPLAEELRAVSARLKLGSDPAAVWSDVAAHPQLGGWGRCVQRAVDSGASVAEAMAAHADDLRGQSRARVEARARAVGVRAALPLGVCLLPAFVLLGVVPLVAGSLSVVRLP